MPKRKTLPNKPKNGRPQKRPNNGQTRSRIVASSLKIAQPSAKSKVRSAYFRVSDASTSKYPDAIRVQGQDFLTSITAANQAAGAVVYNEIINPLTGVFDNSRLGKFAELYEKFLFKDLKFHYDPACPTSTSGGLVLAYDRDPSDPTPAASDHGLHQYYAMMGTRSGPVWDNISIDCPLSDTQNFYYGNGRGGDERLFAQGQIYVSASSLLPTGPLGLLWVEYDILLFDPQLEEKDAVVVANVHDVDQTTTTKHGFNGLVLDANSIANGISLNTDADGNSFFRFAREGVYLILSEWKSTGASTSQTMQPYVNNILDTTKRNSFDVLAGTTGHNNTLINVPRNGLDLYSQFTTAWTGGAGDLFVNIIPSPPEAFTIFTA